MKKSLSFKHLMLFTAMLFAGASFSFAQLFNTPVGVNVDPSITSTSQLYGELDVRGDNIFLTRSQSITPPNFPGRFIGIGESGGVFGPVNGCSFYGFRAQKRLDNFINVGIKNAGSLTDPEPIIDYAAGPAISWGGIADPGSPISRPLYRRLDFDWDASDNDCGETVMSLYAPNFFYTLRLNGNAQATGMWVDSDKRFKNNIQLLESPMDRLRAINGYSYGYEIDKFPQKHFKAGTSFGFLAQELEQVVPEAVHTDEEGYKAVNYDMITPLLVEGVKETDERVTEQEERILELETQLAELQKMVESMQAGSATKTQNGASSLTLPEEIQLFQNVPNPFNESTTISAFLPETVRDARILVFDLQGKQLKDLELNERGQTSVTVDGNMLGAGMYLYSLMVDGKEIDTKRMILTKN